MKMYQVYDDNYFKDIGKKLSYFRQAAGYEAKDLSEITGFSVNKINSLENGESSRLQKVRFENLFRLCFCMGKKVIISFEDLPPEEELEKYDINGVPWLTKDQLMQVLGQRL